MIAVKPDTRNAVPVGTNWLEAVSAASLAGMRRQQKIARAIAQMNISAAEEYANHLRRLSMAEDPMTAWACQQQWLRGSWQRAVERTGAVTQAMQHR